MEVVEVPTPGPGIPRESALQPHTKLPRGYGIYRKPGHRRDTYPDR